MKHLITNAKLSEHDMALLLKEFLGDTFYYLENKKRWVFFKKDAGWIEEKEEELRSQSFYNFLKTLRQTPSSVPKERVEEWEKQRWNCIHNFSDQNGVKSVFEVLRNDLEIRKGEWFDNDAHLLGVANGIVNLKTGKLLPPSKDLLVTQKCQTKYNPRAKAERWGRFVQEVLPSHYDYIQKVMGYCITGETNLQKMWMFVGAGSNGKSTFVENIMDVLGTDYTQKAPQKSVIMSVNTSGASPEITRMKNKRLIVLSETDLEAKLNETNVKQLTGNDTIPVRDLYSGYIQFKNIGKFVMATNHLPKISSNGEAIWRRIEIIRFDARFTFKSDPHLSSKLASESEGILTWLVDGAKAFYSNNRGLKTPVEIRDWVDDYREEEDVLSGFLSERVESSSGELLPAKTFYETYKDWCKDNSVTTIDANQFGRDLSKRGYVRKKMGKQHTTNYLNVKIKSNSYVKTNNKVVRVNLKKTKVITKSGS